MGYLQCECGRIYPDAGPKCPDCGKKHKQYVGIRANGITRVKKQQPKSQAAEIAALKASNAELLEALKEMTDEIEKYGFAKPHSPMVREARAIIKKAEGGAK